MEGKGFSAWKKEIHLSFFLSKKTTKEKLILRHLPGQTKLKSDQGWSNKTLPVFSFPSSHHCNFWWPHEASLACLLTVCSWGRSGLQLRASLPETPLGLCCWQQARFLPPGPDPGRGQGYRAGVKG